MLLLLLLLCNAARVRLLLVASCRTLVAVLDALDADLVVVEEAFMTNCSKAVI